MLRPRRPLSCAQVGPLAVPALVPEWTQLELEGVLQEAAVERHGSILQGGLVGQQELLMLIR